MSLYPTMHDPVVITADDGALFVCWVEKIGGGLRWVAVSASRIWYNLGSYAGEDSLDRIRSRVSEWRRDRPAAYNLD